MIINAKTRLGKHHKNLLPASLLLAVLLTSLSVYALTIGIENPFVNNSNNPSLENAEHVKTENELKNAINNTPQNTPNIIVLDRNIALTESLTIPSNKNITLTSNRAKGFYKLIGANNKTTITIKTGAVLKLDGIIITHPKDTLGTGIDVQTKATLTLTKGKISDNLAHGCGGIFNSGTFNMYGGEISNNKAHGSNGGGIFNSGTFNMYGGEISNNKASDKGGGIVNSGVFNLFAGKISGNTATTGGGVHNAGVLNVIGIFNMSGGEISGNKATSMMGDGGGGVHNSGNFSMTGGTITDNTAGGGGKYYVGVGGGVTNRGGTFTMCDGKITNNKCNMQGGGVYSFGTFNRLGGEISGNTAYEGNDIYIHPVPNA